MGETCACDTSFWLGAAAAGKAARPSVVWVRPVGSQAACVAISSSSKLQCLLLVQGHFPEPEQDPVIQIASLVTEFGQKQPTVRNIMTLKSCAPITGAGEADGVRHAWWPVHGLVAPHVDTVPAPQR